VFAVGLFVHLSRQVQLARPQLRFLPAGSASGEPVAGALRHQMPDLSRERSLPICVMGDPHAADCASGAHVSSKRATARWSNAHRASSRSRADALPASVSRDVVKVGPVDHGEGELLPAKSRFLFIVEAPHHMRFGEWLDERPRETKAQRVGETGEPLRCIGPTPGTQRNDPIT
jgi:hypothetical protein